jgi:hypothetical protein
VIGAKKAGMEKSPGSGSHQRLLQLADTASHLELLAVVENDEEKGFVGHFHGRAA